MSDWFYLAPLIAIPFAALVPFVADLLLAYRSSGRQAKAIADKVAQMPELLPNLNADQIREVFTGLEGLVRESRKPPQGMNGLARAVLALTALVLLGSCILLLLREDSRRADRAGVATSATVAGPTSSGTTITASSAPPATIPTQSSDTGSLVAGNGELLASVVGALTGLFAAITAFYFGGRAAQDAATIRSSKGDGRD